MADLCPWCNNLYEECPDIPGHKKAWEAEVKADEDSRKLKTLKDFLCENPNKCSCNNNPPSLISGRELKQEAINEIKLLRKYKGQPFGDVPLEIGDFYEENTLSVDNVIAYIKWKNNITEEDLK